jgi:flavin-binding protein dodecin
MKTIKYSRFVLSLEVICYMGIYKIIDIVGTSDKSFAAAAKNAVDEASMTVRKIRRAEVTKMDVKVEDDKLVLYRVELKISFEIER